MNRIALQQHYMRQNVIARAASRGMTLIEILVVLAIIGLIMGGIAVVAGGAFQDAQDDTAKNEVIKTVGLVEMYQLKKKGKCPTGMDDLKKAGVLVRVKPDPWGNDYKISCPGEHEAIDVSSAGPDGEFGNEDDVNSWEDKAEGEGDDG
jgi:general secretion pathway protein G